MSYADSATRFTHIPTERIAGIICNDWNETNAFWHINSFYVSVLSNHTVHTKRNRHVLSSLRSMARINSAMQIVRPKQSRDGAIFFRHLFLLIQHPNHLLSCINLIFSISRVSQKPNYFIYIYSVSSSYNATPTFLRFHGLSDQFPLAASARRLAERMLPFVRMTLWPSLLRAIRFTATMVISAIWFCVRGPTRSFQ